MYESELDAVYRRCAPVREWLAAARSAEQELNRALREAAGLTLTQFLILQALEAHQGRLPMTRLAAAVGISRSRLCHSVDAMAELCWVHREPDFADARGVLAVLTDLGAGVLVPAVPAYAAALTVLEGAPLDDRQRTELQTLSTELAGDTAASAAGPDPAAARWIA